MLNVVLFGAPGSGKGTQSELIIRKYGLFHISTGDILRSEIARRSELGLTAEQFINDGKLIPDDLIIKLLSDTLDANSKARGFIFDGFPRTLPQGEALEKLLRAKNSTLAAVINLDVEEDELVRRMINRGKETGRADDNLETIKKRLKVYHTQTEPLKAFYRKQGKLITIRGHNNIDEVFDMISEVLDRLSLQSK